METTQARKEPGVAAEAEQDSKLLRTALGSFTTGITIVSVRGWDGEPVGLTVNSFNSVSLEPPMVLWSLALASPNLDVVKRATHFAVNVLAEEQEPLSQRFASRIPDKFDGVDFSEGLGGVPLLDGCRAWFECRTVARYPGGDHIILLGEVEHFRVDESREPLVYYNGAYRRFSAPA